MAEQDIGAAEDAMFHADLLLAQMKEKQDEKSAPPNRESKFQWIERDCEGRPLLKRKSRSGKTRMRSSATVLNPCDPAEEVSMVTEQNMSQHLLDSEMQKLQEILATTVEASDGPPSTSSSWSLRQSAAQDEWQKARPYHLDCLLFSRVVKENKCSQCSSPAIIRCRDCMPEEWLCMECDIICHKKLVLHNRESCIDGFYRPIPPTVCCVKENGRCTLKNQVRLLPTVRPDRLCTCDPTNITESAGRVTILVCINGRYDLYLPNLACRVCLSQWTPDRSDLIRSGYWPASVNSETLFSVDVFSTFEEMKTVAPGLSRQGFLRLLEQRTEQFGRSGKIHGDAFQRSFVEYTFCQFLCEKMANVEHFTCPACTPNMLAVSADGNRKLYRFQHSKGSEEPYFEGIFIAKDVDVSSFVEEIRSKAKSTPGKGTCGATQWSAARETARRASKLDEEGLEVAVCRHGVILKGLNMYRGEIFAYPLFLQKELQAATNIHFYCTDISCKYWPYLQKMSVSMPELSPLLQMRPFLSVMHAKAQSTKCEIVWSGRNQEGAGATAGEEVEMVNSFLSRCALTTKYMTKSDSIDVRQDDQHILQRSIEHICMGVYQKKASLYNQTDSNKIRQMRRRKLGEEKRKLFEAIKRYNEQVPEKEGINEQMVESRLSMVGHGSGEDSLIWPWEVHSTESTNILTKKKIFDAYMSKMRLQEEKILILREMRQHCTYLRGLADGIRKLIAEMSGGNRGSLTDEGHCGLQCLLQERLADVEEKIKVVSSRYSLALGPLFPEDWSEEIPEIPDENKGLEYESSEYSDLEDV
ncbi:uncharacterized protein LOC128029544 isoform X2 [Carassius gibelio]|uniref:uncharacterized protein LOC128029544 isoform X2 n=1 Tax=Carassius gibelio TaxID=101364 RepID=UPI00227847A9|nr:uncharacterized protein LOC128029544 isoform X2 [Carassius gibelio]